MRLQDRKIGCRLEQLNESLVEVLYFVRERRARGRSLGDLVNPPYQMGEKAISSSDSYSSDIEPENLDEEHDAAQMEKTFLSASGQKHDSTTLPNILVHLSPSRALNHRMSSGCLQVSWPDASSKWPGLHNKDYVSRSRSLGLAGFDSGSKSIGLALRKRLGWGHKKLITDSGKSLTPEVITNKYADLEQLEAAQM